ncbi:MAG: hypothetical protein JWM42_1484 [Burkholderia sp.]|nr:hypothetical protein [Burkholderia sp.]
MRSNRAFAQKISIVVLVCMLAACSALRLGYSNGESVVYWWLNGYVDIEAEQQPWVKKHIANLFAWHRKTQLNEYAKLLTNAQTQLQLQRQVTQVDVLRDTDAFKASVETLVDKALPELTDLALALQPQQIAHLEKKFVSNNDSYRKDYLRGDVEQRQLFRYKKVMKQAEYWFGNFNREQEARIRAASDERSLNNEMGLQMRLRRQQELIALLKKVQNEKLGREATMALLKNYAAGVADHFGDAQHKAFFSASKDGTARMIATIVNIATPEQKARAREKLQRLIEDCHTMARPRA